MSLQFHAPLTDLQAAASWATRTVIERPGLAIWAGLHLKVVGDTVTLSGGDGEVFATAEVAVTGGHEGEAVIGARAFNQWLSALKNSDVQELHLHEDTEHRNIICEAGKQHHYRFRKFSGSYPLPETTVTSGFNTQMDEFAEALKTAQHAIGSGEGPMGGVHVRSTERRFTVTATDSYRMVRIRGTHGLGIFAGVLPRRAVSLLRNLQGEGCVQVDDEGRIFKVSLADPIPRTLLCHTLSGPFPSADQILDSPAEYRLELNREDLLAILARVAPFSSRRGVIRVSGSKESLTVTANSEDVGEVVEQIPISQDASSLDVGLNLEYIREAVEIFEEEQIVLIWNQALGPLRLVGLHQDDVVELIMPVRL